MEYQRDQQETQRGEEKKVKLLRSCELRYHELRITNYEGKVCSERYPAESTACMKVRCTIKLLLPLVFTFLFVFFVPYEFPAML